ncbi:hypothetical protein WG66_008459 [Moniliophthora roreri]|nr:hypothetical protein WG66_008459 [Moniliophthora roreri]
MVPIINWRLLETDDSVRVTVFERVAELYYCPGMFSQETNPHALNIQTKLDSDLDEASERKANLLAFYLSFSSSGARYSAWSVPKVLLQAAIVRICRMFLQYYHTS